MTAARLRILYVVPGHHLLPTAGPTRNVLSLAAELGQRAELSVAFRRVLEPPPGAPSFRVEEIEPGRPTAREARPVDDAAVRGASRRELLAYLRAADAYIDRRAPEVDVVLEKSWLLSGRLAARSARRGTPGALVENLVRVAPRAEGAGLVQRLQHALVRRLVARAARRVPLVIAETEELRRALVARLGLDPERVAVVELGVDRGRFRPRDRDAARRALGLDPGATVLLYAGVFDRAHDLAPLLRALAGHAPPGSEARAPLELHVLGDGERRAEYEALAARARAPVVLHGRVPHDAVPEWIAAADLCVAPYDRASFPGGEVAYSTLKVPEFLACGRPVATVPSGRLRALVADGVSGFLLENEEAAWAALVAGLDRERLRALGEGAAASPAARRSWDAVAEEVLELCERLARESTPRGLG